MPPNTPPPSLWKEPYSRLLHNGSRLWKKNIEGPCILYGLFNLLILADNQTRLPYQEFITQRLYLARMNIGLGLE